MQNLKISIQVCAFAVLLWLPAHAQPGAPRSLTQEIDELYSKRAEELGMRMAPRTDDLSFLRRAYLDIWNKVPSEEDIEAYLATPVEHRQKWACDKLFSPPIVGGEKYNDQVIVRLRDYWTTVLNGGRDQPDGIRGFHLPSLSARKVLGASLKNGIYALMNQGKRVDDPEEGFYEYYPLAEKVSSAFLGVRLACVKCHDHPFNGRKQTDYYGFVGFFRNSVFRVEEKIFTDLEVNRSREVRYRKGSSDVERTTKMNYFGREPTEVETSENTRLDMLERLIAEDPRFAKTMVNRAWGMLFGYGLNAPAEIDSWEDDEMNFPELMERLAGWLRDHDFDLFPLLKALCNSEVYARSSKVTTNARGVPDAPYFFNYHALRPLNQEQLDNLAFDLRLLDGRLEEIFYPTRRNFGESKPERDAQARMDIPQNIAVMTHPGLVFNHPDSGSMLRALESVEKYRLPAPLSHADRIKRLALQMLTESLSEEEVRELAKGAGLDPAAFKKRDELTREELEAYQDVVSSLFSSRRFWFAP